METHIESTTELYARLRAERAGVRQLAIRPNAGTFGEGRAPSTLYPVKPDASSGRPRTNAEIFAFRRECVMKARNGKPF